MAHAPSLPLDVDPVGLFGAELLAEVHTVPLGPSSRRSTGEGGCKLM